MWRFCGLRICEVVEHGRKSVTLVSLVFVVKVWRVRAVVDSERLRDTKVGYGSCRSFG